MMQATCRYPAGTCCRALFLGTQLPHASLAGNAIYVMVEVMVLGVLALIGFVRSMMLADDDADEDTEMAETARS